MLYNENKREKRNKIQNNEDGKEYLIDYPADMKGKPKRAKKES